MKHLVLDIGGVFVGDLIGHVEAARSLGFAGVHFRTTDQALVELAALYPATSLSSRL